MNADWFYHRLHHSQSLVPLPDESILGWQRRAIEACNFLRTQRAIGNLPLSTFLLCDGSGVPVEHTQDYANAVIYFYVYARQGRLVRGDSISQKIASLGNPFKSGIEDPIAFGAACLAELLVDIAQIEPDRKVEVGTPSQSLTSSTAALSTAFLVNTSDPKPRGGKNSKGGKGGKGNNNGRGKGGKGTKDKKSADDSSEAVGRRQLNRDSYSSLVGTLGLVARQKPGWELAAKTIAERLQKYFDPPLFTTPIKVPLTLARGGLNKKDRTNFTAEEESMFTAFMFLIGKYAHEPALSKTQLAISAYFRGLLSTKYNEIFKDSSSRRKSEI
jgi:hypothetical protein